MKYVQGDLIQMFKQGKFDLIGHQCNCFSVMGGGIAGVLAAEFPQITQGNSEKLLPEEKFGTYEVIDGIINMYSQYRSGGCHNQGIDSFEIRTLALKHILYKINYSHKGKSIGLPFIASGIAADTHLRKSLGVPTVENYFKTFIAPIIEDCLVDMDVTIVYL